MRVALIVPEWKFENPYPPLGLAYIAAVLENNGHNVMIFDLTLDNIPFEVNMENIIRFSPDIIGVSCMTHNYYEALKVSTYIKDRIDIPIVFGGPHPTIMPQEVLSNKSVDFIIMGEGEYTFLRLCQEFENKAFNGIDGLCFKDNGNIIIQPRKHFISNLDELPFPARHLLKLDSYILTDDYKNKMITIISSRGCPYRCTYCYKGLFGRIYRQRSYQNIIDEIKYCIDKFGYRSFYFIDDLFTLNTKRVKGLTDTIKKEDLNIRWQCLARVNNTTPEIFKQMKDAGCYKVHFGIESGNQYILDKVKKDITIEQVKTAVRHAKDSGVKTKGYFMLGMPGDTSETMRDTLNLAKELEIDDIMFSITTPFPGTELWNAIDKNKISSLSNAFYFMNNDDDDINIFYNLSDTTDENIIDMMRNAHDIREDLKIRSFCNRSFGKNIGFFVWQLSKISLIKNIGKRVIKI